MPDSGAAIPGLPLMADGYGANQPFGSRMLFRVADEVEFKDPLEVGERVLGEDDHASLRALGRAPELPPCERRSRYSNTSSAGIPAPVFFIFASLRLASATNCARASSASSSSR